MGTVRRNDDPPDDPCHCEMCWNLVDECACPECTICSEMGNPKCYTAKDPHMVLDEIQLNTINKNIDLWDQEGPEPEDFW